MADLRQLTNPKKSPPRQMWRPPRQMWRLPGVRHGIPGTSHSLVFPLTLEANMSISTPTMPTIGEIARRLGEPIHRIEYVIRARRIGPCGWAGNARVFPEEAVESIAIELQHITAGKFRRRPSGRDA